MIYIALLRGINVGGKNMIDMKRLKMTFESLGFTSVTTYINSGNIVFEHVNENAALQTHVRKTGDVAEEQRAKEDKADLTSLIEQAIKRDFQLEIKTVVVNSNELDEICQELPITWVKSKEMRTDVMFLWEKYDRPEVLDSLKLNAVDNVKYVPGALLWNVMEADYSKSGMMKLMGTDLYRHMTIRNVNTVRKLQEMVSIKKTTR